MRTWESLCDAWVPSGGSLLQGARDLQVPEHLEELLEKGDPFLRRLVEGLLYLTELSPLFSPHGHRLSELPPEEAGSHLNALMRRGGMVGSGANLLRHLIEGAYSAMPPVRSELGVGEADLAGLPPPQGPLPTLAYPALGVRSVRETDAVIIGSGAGGAPVAKVLAEAGWRVLVLEEGPAFSRKDFTGAPLDRMARHYRGGGFLLTLGKPTISVVEAVAVGGTTVFNSGSCFRPPSEVLQGWSTETHLSFLTTELFQSYLERAERTMEVATPREEILGGNAAVARRGARALGLSRHGIIRRPAPGCRGSDECVLGCPTDAKRSMALSYLPLAVRKGAQILSGVSVQRIRQGRGGRRGWTVRAEVRDPATGQARGNLEVHAKFVVVAAGALHTASLLPSVGDRNAARHRGEHLRVHPSFEVAGEMSEPVQGWNGVLQPYYVEDLPDRVLLEATFQPRGILSTSGLLPLWGQAYKNYLPTLANWAVMGGMISESSEGRLLPPLGGRPWMRYDLGAVDLARLSRAMALAGRVLLAAGARRVYLPVGEGRTFTDPGELGRFAERPLDPGLAHLFAFHPLGTTRMSGEPELGAVDERGIVWGTEGLDVSDAGLLPGSPFVNPMISIIALAEHSADLWVREGLHG